MFYHRFRRHLLHTPCAAAAILLLFSNSANAQNTTPAASLKRVPTDAAIFVHVDVETLWKSKLGDTVRAAKAKELDRILNMIQTESGLGIENVKTVTYFFNQLKQPADFQAPIFHVELNKPYDRAKLLELAKKQLGKGKWVDDNSGIHSLLEEGGTDPAFTLSLKDPQVISLGGKGAKKFLTEAVAQNDGPQTHALRAAADGNTAVIGLNFANFPDEIRGEEIPAEVRPFLPIIRSDSAYAVGKLQGEKLQFDVHFRNTERAKAAEVEKSLAALMLLLQTALDSAVKELTNEKQEDLKALLPLAQGTIEFLKTIKIKLEGNEVIASGTTTTEIPFGPLLQQQFGGATGANARAVLSNNLKQIGLALHNYHDVYNGFPPAALVNKKGKPMLSWRVMILPFIEHEELYKKFNLDEPWDSEHNKKVFENNPMPKVFAVPGVTKDEDKTTHVQVFVGEGAMFDPIQTTKIQSITDGTSNTLMAATMKNAVPWTKPDDVSFDPKVDPRTLLLFDNNGTNVLFADGSVRFISKKVSEDTLKAIITRSGGEVVSDIP